MLIFALANAGVAIEPNAIGSGIALVVATGLVLGRPLGIVLLSWLAVRRGLAQLPCGVNWKAMIARLPGWHTGFRRSLFIAGLALEEILGLTVLAAMPREGK